MTAIADVGSEVPWGIVLACPFVAAFVLWAAITWTTARAEAEDADPCEHGEDAASCLACDNEGGEG